MARRLPHLQLTFLDGALIPVLPERNADAQAEPAALAEDLVQHPVKFFLLLMGDDGIFQGQLHDLRLRKGDLRRAEKMEQQNMVIF